MCSIEEYEPGDVLWIVINQKRFDSCDNQNLYSERIGAEMDEANLIEALRSFKIDLRVWNDLKLYEILGSLKGIYEEIEKELNRYDGLVILGMSHGEHLDGKDYFVTSDCKLLLTEKVADLFHNCYCMGLKNKPKFYMWNMCRGDRSNAEVEKTKWTADANVIESTAKHISSSPTKVTIRFPNLLIRAL